MAIEDPASLRKVAERDRRVGSGECCGVDHETLFSELSDSVQFLYLLIFLESAELEERSMQAAILNGTGC